MVKVIDVGRVVVKVLGREAGRKAVVVDSWMRATSWLRARSLLLE